MTSPNDTRLLDRLSDRLLKEHIAYAARERGPEAKMYQSAQEKLLDATKAVGHDNNIETIMKAERKFLENERALYGNSKTMRGSLDIALNEISAAEKLIDRVQTPESYKTTDQAHSLPKNRLGGVPRDEARQFFRSHSARLLNQDKTRLTKIEKRTVDTRRNNLRVAEKAYVSMQRQALGLAPKEKGREQGRSR